ncbi:MAG TPA: hypothetical protein VN632_10740 [Stellaceae bacterium]|nr:hypothetical protein [Stellaceae bacterium]
MKAKYILSSLVLVSGIALAAPGFAQDRGYGDGMKAGSLGMDVAPGGGTYTRADVSAEDPGRMSHPVVGERRAPSNFAQGSLQEVDEAERSETAKLNMQQLQGGGETAQLPNNE